MELVADANILFSSLIKDGKTVELLLDPFFKLYTPDFILQEFKNHEQEILEKTDRSEEEFNEILEAIKKIIWMIPEQEFSEYLKEAEQISPDPDDIMYFALALKLNCPVWSNDKKLKEQNQIKVYSTDELIAVLEKM